MYVSTLPFTGTVDENWSFSEFLEHLTENWYDMLRHQRYPLCEIMQSLRESHKDQQGPGVQHRPFVPGKPDLLQPEHGDRLFRPVALQRIPERASVHPPEQHGKRETVLGQLRLFDAALFRKGNRRASLLYPEHLKGGAGQPREADLAALHHPAPPKRNGFCSSSTATTSSTAAARSRRNSARSAANTRRGSRSYTAAYGQAINRCARPRGRRILCNL